MISNTFPNKINPKELTDDSHVKLGSLTHAKLVTRTKNTEYDRMLT